MRMSTLAKTSVFCDANVGVMERLVMKQEVRGSEIKGDSSKGGVEHRWWYGGGGKKAKVKVRS